MINDIYLDEKLIRNMRKYFLQNNFISFENFFNHNIKKIQKDFLKQKFYEEIILDEFKKYKTNYENDFTKFLRSKKFINIVEKITQKKLKLDSLEILKYNHFCYKLIKDEKVKKDKILVVFDLTKNWEDDFGGTLTFLKKDRELFHLKPNFDFLTIINYKKDILYYLKYINVNSKKNFILRVFIQLSVK